MKYEEFVVLWDKIIVPEAKILEESYSGLIFADHLRDDVYNECSELILHSKSHYMRNSKGFLDRHKISAIIMIAILKNTPIKTIGVNYYTKESKMRGFNEQLAITTGLSVLRAFIETDLKNEYSGAELEKKLNQIAEGIKFPQTRHGDYRKNWAVELYYTRKEGNYNILALSNELFMLEHNTLCLQ